MLGPLQVTLDGEPVTDFKSDKVRALLVYLAVEAEQPHHRETLAGLLWPEWPDREARRNLRDVLSNLRRAIGDHDAVPPFLHITRDTLQFNQDSEFWLDVAVFASLKGLNDLEALEQGVHLYRGSFLEGFSISDAAPFEEWALLKREQLSRQMLQTLHSLAVIYEQQGEYERAQSYARQQVQIEPWNEEAHQQLMRVLALGGQRSAALAQYQACSRLLADELGVGPAQETTALFESIRDGTLQPTGPDLVPAEEPPAPGQAPFKGLQHFDIADAGLFFGREDLTDQLVARLSQGRFLAVLGASGSGKSSVVRAGLIPTLQRAKPQAASLPRPSFGDAWLIHLITPTEHPLTALATSLTRDVESVTAAATLVDDLSQDPRALALYARRLVNNSARGDSDGCLLLVVDQFEELFTICQDTAERQAFVANLSTACTGETAGPVRVAIALRADFYAHCSQFAVLRETLAQNQVYIGPMSRKELRRAIEEPAQTGGWTFEPGLVDLILDEVGNEPGALPLLSHALLETWRQRRGRTLTVASYLESGGVRGAIARTAETTYEQLAPGQQAIARNIFLRLTELGEDTQDTRRRAELSELIPHPEDAPAVKTVLKMLADARLITTDKDSVEVAHEALVREWPRLREWLDENREDLQLHQRISQAAQEWDRLDRDPSVLYRGPRLAQAMEWSQRQAPDLNPLESTFLDASQARAEQATQEREAQRRRELEAARQLAEAEKQRAEAESRRAKEQEHAARRLRRRAAFLTAALILAVVLGIVAVELGRQGRERAQIASARELSLAAHSNLDIDPERSILLALQSAQEWSALSEPIPYDLQATLHQAVQSARTRLRWSAGGDDILHVGFDPENERPLVVTGNRQDSTVTVWDPETNQALLTLPGRVGQFTDVDLSPDGAFIAVPGDSGSVTVWEMASGQAWRTLSGHSGEVLGTAYSPGGDLLATYSTNEQIIWEVDSGKRLLELPAPTSETNMGVFSPDGTQIATIADFRVIKIIDIASGRERISLEHDYDIISFAFSPDGRRVAAGGHSATVQVWDVETGQTVQAVAVGTAPQVEAIAYSPDGARLEVADCLFDAATGQELFALRGHTHGIPHLAFNGDGTRVITASYDGTTRVWDLTPAHELFARPAHGGMVYDIAYGPDGRLLATAGRDGTAIIWAAESGEAVHVLAGHTDVVNGAAFSPDGGLLATASADRSVIVWETATGQKLRTLIGHDADKPGGVPLFRGVIAAAFGPQCLDPSGTPPGPCPLATVGMDGQLIVWDAQSGQRLFDYQDAIGGLKSVAFSPDGKLLAIGSTGEPVDTIGTATIVEVASGEILSTMPGHAGWVWGLAFSPDGERLATVDFRGVGRVWDVVTGEPLIELTGPPSGFSVTYCSTGDRLATGSGDGTITLWDAESGLPQLSLGGQGDPVGSLACSPDGGYLAAAGFDGTMRVYVVEPSRLLALARSRLTRSFTLEECRTYLHMEQCPAAP
jgi:WD40 repeat protein/DNA-binding SARP family transcriptional activator/energy-coupling factor transporter ATP-binding protein EcfA2